MTRANATLPLATMLPPAGGPLVQHRLGAVLRIVDPFVPAPVPLMSRSVADERFIVRIPRLSWTARYSLLDRDYRFVRANVSRDVEWEAAVFDGIAGPQFPAIPVSLPVEVVALEPTRARYWVPDPVALTLPRPPAAAIPETVAQQLARYMVEVEAYPTALFRAPGGETCIRGVVRSNTLVPRAGVEVAVYPEATLPAGRGFTRTDAQGFFVYRLPWLKRGAPSAALPHLGVTVRPVGGAEFPAIQAFPHPATDLARAEFAHGVTTSISILAQ